MNRRSLGILLAVAMLVASLATPAVAKKGGNGEPGGIDVTVDPVGQRDSGFYWFPWAIDEGDTFGFVVTVTNKSVDTITIDSVTGVVGAAQTHVVFDLYWIDEETGAPNRVSLTHENGEVSPHEAATFKANYEVTPDDSSRSEIVMEVEVVAGAVTENASATVEVHPIDDCAYDSGTYTSTGEICRWKPVDGEGDPLYGNWTIEFTVGPDSRRTNLTITSRDHVPGNWCGNGQWRGVSPGDMVSLDVYLPDGTVEGEDEGVCLAGGHGGESFGVGNTESFYLWMSVPGTFTVTSAALP